MAVTAKKPVDEEVDAADPTNVQYQHGMQAGLAASGTTATPPPAVDGPITSQTSLPSSGGALTSLPRPAQVATTGNPPVNPSPVAVAPNQANTAVSGAINSLPRTTGAGPAVGGTQAVIMPPKIDLPRTRNRNQIAITADPKDFFRR